MLLLPPDTYQRKGSRGLPLTSCAHEKQRAKRAIVTLPTMNNLGLETRIFRLKSHDREHLFHLRVQMTFLPKTSVRFSMVRSLFTFTLFLPALAFAQVLVSEIMYDLAEGSDSGREWIEIYNASGAPVTLSELILFENKSNHKITGESLVPPGGFAIIADKPEKFRVDYPSYTGLLFDSAFSLNNEGESIELRRGETVLDTASHVKSLGGNGSGESLQRTALARDAAFAPGAPTPGAGVPATGLARIAPPVKAKSETKTATPAPPPGILGMQTNSSFEPFEIRQETAGMGLWLLGVSAIAGVAITGSILGRPKDELDVWTIIEEM